VLRFRMAIELVVGDRIVDERLHHVFLPLIMSREPRSIRGNEDMENRGTKSEVEEVPELAAGWASGTAAPCLRH
jgi:hypothetical protein